MSKRVLIELMANLAEEGCEIRYFYRNWYGKWAFHNCLLKWRLLRYHLTWTEETIRNERCMVCRIPDRWNWRKEIYQILADLRQANNGSAELEVVNK